MKLVGKCIFFVPDHFSMKSIIAKDTKSVLELELIIFM